MRIKNRSNACKQEAQATLQRIVKRMHERGFSTAKIAEDLGKTEAKILVMLKG